MQSSFIPSAVIFDMDGLLLDSERKSQEVLLKAAEILGAPLTPELALKMVGRNASSGQIYLTELFGNPILVNTFIQTASQLYEAEFEGGRIPLKTGVNELLDTLDELKIPRAIATSTKRHIAIRKLTKVGVITRFNYIVGGDEVAHGKPAPDIYLKACSFLSTSPKDCLACEDSAFGIEAAHTAGLRAILVPDLITPTERMISHAWKVLPSLHEVSSLVRELRGSVVPTV
jgi:HAD superfamily hydrolase (TIGR01509 family)